MGEFSEIYLCLKAVDMRKSIGGLSAMAQEVLEADWSKAQLFIFSNRRRNLMKIIYFDSSGFALWMKRLEEGKFPWPREVQGDRVEIGAEDLKMLLSGINVWTRFKRLEYRSVI